MRDEYLVFEFCCLFFETTLRHFVSQHCDNADQNNDLMLKSPAAGT